MTTLVPPPLPPPPAPPKGVTPHLLHAGGGIWHLTWRSWIAPGRAWLGGVLLAALGLLAFVAADDSAGTVYLDWIGEFYLGVLVPISSFLLGAGSMRDDFKPGTVDYILTRPVPRPYYVLFRYGAQLVCATGFGLAALAVLAGVGAFRSVPRLAEVLPLLAAAQLLATAAFVALGFVCAALTSRYLVLGVVYGAGVEVGLGQIPIQLNRLSILHHVRLLFNQVLVGYDKPATGESLASVALLLVIAVGLMAISAAVYALREWTGDQPKDT